MIAVLDIGLGNIGSICNALKFLKYRYEIVKDDAVISDNIDKIIFPGVGSYFEAARRLEKSIVIDSLKQRVMVDKIPILGICLGMQLLTKKGYEHGEASGLGFVNAEVKKIVLEDKKLVLPHMGWNAVHRTDDGKLFQSITADDCFYFVHSFECVFNDICGVNLGYTDYGRNIVASFTKDNVYGVQFHPEKSQKAGLQLLRNYVESC